MALPVVVVTLIDILYDPGWIVSITSPESVLLVIKLVLVDYSVFRTFVDAILEFKAGSEFTYKTIKFLS